MNHFICESLASENSVAAAFDGKEGLRLAREFADTSIILLTAKSDDELIWDRTTPSRHSRRAAPAIGGRSADRRCCRERGSTAFNQFEQCAHSDRNQAAARHHCRDGHRGRPHHGQEFHEFPTCKGFTHHVMRNLSDTHPKNRGAHDLIASVHAHP
jgi:hypothetical protein